MTEEPPAAVRRAIDAIARGDEDVFVSCCAGDVELEPLIAGVEGGYRGHAGVRDWLRDRAENWDLDFDVGPFRRIGSADAWMADGRIRMRSRLQGVPLEQPVVAAVRTRAGLIAWCGLYSSEAEALERVRAAG